MIQRIAAERRYRAEHGWLQSYHLFSFAEYVDQANMGFGSLRVFNDDWIDARSGFGPHPHKDMEIVTIMFSGALTHQDSMGNRAVLHAGEVQRMTAGTGIVHEEMNEGDEPVELYQIWIYPERKGLAPSYEQKAFAANTKKNSLLPVASGQGYEGSLTIQTPATVFLVELEADHDIEIPITSGRGLFLYVRAGEVVIDGVHFLAGDQARITDLSSVLVRARTQTTFVVIDVPVV